jgi:hypothetical protein
MVTSDAGINQSFILYDPGKSSMIKRNMAISFNPEQPW